MSREGRDLSHLWQQMFDAVPDLIMVLDTEHRILWLNTAMATRLKVSRAAAIGGRCYQLLHGKAHPVAGCPFCLTRNSGFTQTSEDSISGVEGIFLISTAPLRDHDGRLVGCLHIARDITERRRVEDELRRERDFSAAVLETMDILIVVLDDACRIVHFNRTCEELTGLEAGETKGRPFWDLLPLPEEQEKAKTMLTALTQGLVRNRYETYWPSIKGESRLVSWSNTAVRRPDGSLQYIIATGLDITERDQAERKMARLAHYDILTELPNRKLFADRLQQAMARARRNHTLIGVLFLDLDNFKPINDNLGHDTGDLLLAEVAGRIKGAVRESDTIGRMGGDEFVAAVEGLQQKEDLAPVARKIIASLSRPYDLKNTTCRIGVSIGAAFYPEDGAEIEALVKKADQAMYEAKKAGGNTFKPYRAVSRKTE